MSKTKKLAIMGLHWSHILFQNVIGADHFILTLVLKTAYTQTALKITYIT